VIVPRRLRPDWRQEWEAELQHREAVLAEWDNLNLRNKLDLLRRSLGAFRDAMLLQPKRLEDEMFQDLGFGFRMLLKHKGFTAIAVLTLALGIGANTAIFSVVDALLLRPLPYHEPEGLIWVGGWARNADKEQGVTPADFLDYRGQSRSFAQFAASISDSIPMNLSGTGEPERLKGGSVTANYLDVFGVKPALGRTFVVEEDQPGRNRVVVLSYSLWERRFGADPAILNQTISLDGFKFTVIGVMPPQFQYPPGVEIWKPFGFPRSPQDPFRSREFHFLRPVAKLKPGVTIAQAQAEIETIARRLEAVYPKTNTNESLFLMPLQERIVGNIKLTLLVLLGAVGCVLLIACANVASLLLARAATRQKEIAVRAALGASAGNLLYLVIRQGMKSAVAGLAIGMSAAFALTRLMKNLLFGVQATDPVTFASIAFLLTAIALLACYLPARKATKIDSLVALRHE
jgi:putative ABC transport system permease protein